MEDSWEVVREAGAGQTLSTGAAATDKNTVFFRKTFGLQDERPCYHEFCTVDGTQGWVYLSKRHLCFVGGLLRKVTVVVGFADVVNVSRESWQLGRSLVLHLDDGSRVSVTTAPFAGSGLLDQTEQLWRASKEQQLTLAEGHERGDAMDMMLDRAAARSAQQGLYRQRNDSHEEAELRQLCGGSSAFELMRASAGWAFELEGRLLKSGTLYVATGAICWGHAKASVAVAALEVTAVTVTGLRLTLELDGALLVFQGPDLGTVDELGDLVRGMWRGVLEGQAQEAKEAASMVENGGPGPMYFTKEMLADAEQFGEHYADWAGEREAAWHAYAQRYGRGSQGRLAGADEPRALWARGRRVGPPLVQQLRMWHQLACEDGVADGWRGEVWARAAGAALLQAASPGRYRRMRQEADGRAEDLSFLRDISKDVERTLPSHPYYQTSEGVAALGRVLGAHSFQNPRVGYTQSMNFVTAVFLLYMDEEMAFWMLTSLCEHIAPHAYRKSMVGSLAQLSVLERLLTSEQPVLFQHLDSLGFHVTMVATGWYMCLYITFLPWEAVLRVFDNYFCGSPVFLHRMALAVFTANEQALMDCSDLEDVLAVLNRRNYPPEQLISLALCLWPKLTDSVLNSMQAEETARAIRRAALESESAMVKTLVAQGSPFSQTELQRLFAGFRENLGHLAAVGVLGPQEFNDALLGVLESEGARWEPGHAQLLWERTAKDKRGVGFEQYAKLLGTLARGLLPSRLLLCVSLFELDPGRGLRSSGLLAAVRATTGLYGCNCSHTQLRGAVQIMMAGNDIDPVSPEMATERLLMSQYLENECGVGSHFQTEVGEFEAM